MKNLETLHSELDNIVESLEATAGILQALTRSQMFIENEYSVGDSLACGLVENMINKDHEALENIASALGGIIQRQEYSILPETTENYKGKTYNSLKKLQSDIGNTLIEVKEASLLLDLPCDEIIDMLREKKISGQLLPADGKNKLRWYVSLNLMEDKYQLTYWKSKGALK